MELEKVDTRKLVEELYKRDGVGTYVVKPYEKSPFMVDGPAIVLVVTH